MTQWLRINTGDVQVAVDPELGNLRVFEVQSRDVLHTAHWINDRDEAETQAQVALPVERKLAGDFFCAPFGGSGLDDVPAHGWTANSSWSLLSRAQNETCAVLALELDRDIFGARVCKELRIKAGHPAIYQKHVIEGGRGPLTYAHHPMVSMQAGGHVGFSAKRAAITPATSLEVAHRLSYPAQTTDLSAFPAADGGSFDLHHYPDRSVDSEGHEDFVTLVEAEGASFGWTAVTRVAEDNIVLFLKDPRTAPVTMLWYSNGGRDYAPWDGKHIGVLGVEDGCAAGAATLAQASSDNPVSDTGIATALHLSPKLRTQIHHAIVSVSRPKGWQGVADVERLPSEDMLRLTSLSGEVLDVPFDCSFL